jgi:YesN/AraC family two-component response regulator
MEAFRRSWRHTVLVVDDHSSVREALGLILDNTYAVLYAEDGPSALALLAAQQVDVVLLDLGLREMDGFDVLIRIRSLSPSVPVIILTIRNTAADAVRALRLGARDYLTKPFDEETVHAKLEEALAVPTALTTWGRKESAKKAGRVLASPEDYIRPRCLVLAAHVGTAATLRLILDRYVPTNASTDCFLATQILGITSPDCIVIDYPAWAADGSSFVRVLRMRFASSQVALLRDGTEFSTSEMPQTNLGIIQCNRLNEVIRFVLRTAVLAGTMMAREPLSDHVIAALDYLRTHYGDPLNADGIAHAAAMSRSYLAQRFQDELGTSVGRFLMRLRVEAARLLLTERNPTLHEVAGLTGFGDPSHLSRVFKAQTGYRPGAYRRRFGLSQ